MFWKKKKIGITFNDVVEVTCFCDNCEHHAHDSICCLKKRIVINERGRCASLGKTERIHHVKFLYIGDIFEYEGDRYRVTKFPTRYTVYGEAIEKKVGEPIGCNVSIRKVRKINAGT